MKRFKNTDSPTNKEWDELFATNKEFKEGDIVEYNHSICVVKERLFYHPFKKDIIYKLNYIYTGETTHASSTYMMSIGTFVDDILYKGSTK